MKYDIGTRVFRDWKIVRCINSGAFGTVYELEKVNHRQAEQVELKAALKVIRIPQNESDIWNLRSQGMSNEEISEYFQSVAEKAYLEVEAMAQLGNHPNIVACDDYAREACYYKEEDDGYKASTRKESDVTGWVILIRMKLFTELRAYRKSCPMDEAAVRQMAKEICNALVACQEKQLVHRDIKPSNIFVDEWGNFKLGDFGIAHTVRTNESVLSFGGTPDYMAPEFYNPNIVGGNKYQVDVYSLGMVLYEMMNGNRLPFYPLPPKPIRLDDREEAKQRRIKGEPVPPPCEASAEFAAVIRKACAADPGERYESAKKMRADLETLPAVVPPATSRPETTKEAETVPLPPSPKKDRRKKRRMPILVLMVVIAAVLLLLRSCDDHRSIADNPGSSSSQMQVLIQVPDVVGKPIDEALQILDDAGLEAELRYAVSDTQPEGIVLEMGVNAYTEVEAGSLILLTVSSGKKLVEVPDVLNRLRDDAEIILRSQGFEVEIHEDYSDTTEAGKVAAQSAQGGQTLPEGSTVTITVSLGKKPLQVPDVVGQPRERAVEMLEALGLIAEITEAYDDAEAGKVIRQSPVGGSTQAVGSTVTLVVSKGKQPVGVTGITLNKTGATLLIGGTVQLSADVTASGAANTDVTWVSGNPAVATVNDKGLVTAKAPGTAIITVKTVSGGKSAACTIKVTAPTIDKSGTYTCIVDQEETVDLVISNAGTATFSYTATSSKPAVVGVTCAGSQMTFSCKRPGTATITVKATTGSYTITKTFTVTVKTPKITLEQTSGTASVGHLFPVSGSFQGFLITLPAVRTTDISIFDSPSHGWELVSGPAMVNGIRLAYYGSSNSSFSATEPAVFRYYIKTKSGDCYYSPNFTVTASEYRNTVANNKLQKTVGSTDYYTLIPANTTLRFTEFKISGFNVYGKTSYGGYTGWVAIQ